MDAQFFDQQFTHTLVAPLTKMGFQVHGNCLSYTKQHTLLALLRFQLKFSGLAHETHFLLCVRHTFLRTLEKETVKGFLSNATEYPFKLPVSRLSSSTIMTWHYQPMNLGPREYDTISFGKLTDASSILLQMRERISSHGLSWMEYLTPSQALGQIRKHGGSAYCEKIWMEDYERFAGEAVKENVAKS